MVSSNVILNPPDLVLNTLDCFFKSYAVAITSQGAYHKPTSPSNCEPYHDTPQVVFKGVQNPY